MSDYKPKLKLSQFKKMKREYTQEDLEAEIKKASMRFMEPEILHDVKIAGIVKDSVKFNENNPTWIQFGLILENAAGEVANVWQLIPIGQDFDFVGKSGNKTTAPLANFGKFMQVLGLSGLSTQFLDRLIETDCDVLEDLIGFQLRYIAKWNKKKLHGWYDAENQAWFLVDYQGALACEEPFQLPSKDEVEKPEQRWAEMATKAEELGFAFESGANGQILEHPEIVNPIEQLGINPNGDTAAKEAAQTQSKPKVASPKVQRAVVSAKPAAKKAPPPPTEEDGEEEEYESGEGPIDPSEFEVE